MQLQAIADLLAAAGDRRDRLVVGQVEEHALDLLVDRRGQQAERLGARLLGREVRVAGVGAEHRVHRPVTAPSSPTRSSSRVPGSSSASSQPSRALGDVVLEHAERRVHELAGELVPAGQRGDVREVARRQEAQHLELGVVARLQAAEDLQDEARRRGSSEVLDCSAPIARDVPAGRATPGQLKATSPTVAFAGRAARRARAPAIAPVAAGRAAGRARACRRRSAPRRARAEARRRARRARAR